MVKHLMGLEQWSVTAAHITAKHSKALYTYCASHRLNLCVVRSCAVREISNMMQSADKLSQFFSNSSKRQLTGFGKADQQFVC